MLLESSCLPRFTLVLILFSLFWVIRDFGRELILSLTRKDPAFCGRENMSFSSYLERNETSRGQSFSCNLMKYLDEWKISDKFAYKLKPVLVDNVVFLTYSSSNHFTEARQGIRSWRAAFKNKIVFYDLGLKKSEIKELQNVCNLEVRKFEFHRYPRFVSNLLGYHFKAIIMAEVFSEFENYWIVDTSVRFFNLTSNLDEFYSNITKGVIEPFALRKPVTHSIFASTHPGMYKYLPVDARLAKQSAELAAGLTFISSSEVSREAVKWNALCALTKDCMAPSGSRGKCRFGKDSFNSYANCHRYDQSSINIIMASLLERDGWKRRDRLRDNSMIMFTDVKRNVGDTNNLNIPCGSE